ncbi:MAG: EthD domain-containing protein [Chloroflexi bacterium]|nr:EthD domain-containing protein [Chloroflexota bacterium]
MIKLVYCLRRVPNLSREEFQRYWREKHAPLVKERAETLGIRRYVQVHTIDSGFDAALRSSRGSNEEAFDGVAELWWDDTGSLASSTATDEARKASRELLEDEGNFIDFSRSVIFVAEEYLVVG